MKSTASSARMKAEAKKAALMARAASLAKKHALELEEAKIREMKEKLKVETDLAASEAEISVFKNYERLPQDSQDNPVDGMEMMNTQLEEQRKPFRVSITSEHERSPVNYAPIYVVPKTPLQRSMQSKQLLQPMSAISRSIQDQVDSATTNQLMNDISANENILHTILKQQTDLTEMLLKQQNMALLPTREVPVYNGDHLSFIPFMQAFEYNIENKTKK